MCPSDDPNPPDLPPNFRFTDGLWVFLATDPTDNSEGIMAMSTPSGWQPMMAGDRARLDSIRPIAVHQARQTGRPVRLVHFTNREDVEIIDPMRSRRQ